jgi:hypothetical protein
MSAGTVMKAQGKVKGILIEGSDGHEYLLGFGPANAPVFSRRRADGAFVVLEDIRVASKVAMTQLGMTGSFLIGSGMGQNLFLWGAYREALKAFPPIPTWPTWSSES